MHEHIDQQLARRLGIDRIRSIALEAAASPTVRDTLLHCALTDRRRSGLNALWVLTHLPQSQKDWLQSYMDEFISALLAAEKPAQKRMLLQILRDLDFDRDSLRADFLDYCLEKITDEKEPYAARCFSLYCAHSMCRSYPELLAELRLHLDLLSMQQLSPGLRCALRKVRAATGSTDTQSTL